VQWGEILSRGAFLSKSNAQQIYWVAKKLQDRHFLVQLTIGILFLPGYISTRSANALYELHKLTTKPPLQNFIHNVSQLAKLGSYR
jgi:hypothetical protein